MFMQSRDDAFHSIDGVGKVVNRWPGLPARCEEREDRTEQDTPNHAQNCSADWLPVDSWSNRVLHLLTLVIECKGVAGGKFPSAKHHKNKIALRRQNGILVSHQSVFWNGHRC
jgi:hypothetical protein